MYSCEGGHRFTLGIRICVEYYAHCYQKNLQVNSNQQVCCDLQGEYHFSGELVYSFHASAKIKKEEII